MPGQIAVEDHGVAGVDVELGCGLQTVVRDINGYAPAAEVFGEYGGQRPRLLDDEHPHARTPPAVPQARRRIGVFQR
jgi:hypothetical protein